VSTALVSIVIRGVPGASAESRQRNLEAADELGYRPDTRARLLRSSRSRLLGVVFGVQQPFHGDLVGGLYQAADPIDRPNGTAVAHRELVIPPRLVVRGTTAAVGAALDRNRPRTPDWLGSLTAGDPGRAGRARRRGKAGTPSRLRSIVMDQAPQPREGGHMADEAANDQLQSFDSNAMPSGELYIEQLKLGVPLKAFVSDPDTGMSVQMIRYAAGFTNPWHRHNCAHGIYVLEGTLRTHAGTFGPGSFVWFPEGMLMEHGATDDGDMVALFITNKPFDIRYAFEDEHDGSGG